MSRYLKRVGIRTNNMSIKKEYKAYLFDMDGTLVNSEKLKGLALSKTCTLFRGQASVDVYKAVMGESWEKVRSHFLEVAQINPDAEDFDEEFRNIYMGLLGRVEANPNVVQLLTDLKKQGKKLGLVSSASSWMMDQVLERIQLTGFFDVVISKEHVNNHKPAPDAYMAALEKLSLPSSEVLIFEDSYAGLVSAHKAKCDVVAFKHEFNYNHDFRLAVQTIADYKEFAVIL